MGKQRKAVWRALEHGTPRGFNQDQFQRNSLLYLIILTCLLWPTALGVSFLLCALLAKQRSNYANNERLIKSRFRRGDAAVKKWDSWRFIYEETLKFVNKTKYCKTLNMLSNKIRILGIICTKCLGTDDNLYFY